MFEGPFKLFKHVRLLLTLAIAYSVKPVQHRQQQTMEFCLGDQKQISPGQPQEQLMLKTEF